MTGRNVITEITLHIFTDDHKMSGAIQGQPVLGNHRDNCPSTSAQHHIHVVAAADTHSGPSVTDDHLDSLASSLITNFTLVFVDLWQMMWTVFRRSSGSTWRKTPAGGAVRTAGFCQWSATGLACSDIQQLSGAVPQSGLW